MAEAMPAVLAAVVAGAVCAVVLPAPDRLVDRPVRVHRHQRAGTFQPGLAALGLPAAAVLVLAVAVLAAEARRCAVAVSPACCGQTKRQRRRTWAPASRTWARSRRGTTGTSARAR